MTTTTTPVVIIGCGPAGASASMFLSKAGIYHTIIEKDTYPRDKVCGDGCSGKTAFVLRKANPKYLEEIFADGAKFLPSYGVTFVAPNGKALDVPFTLDKSSLQHPPGFTSKRIDLDHFLFQKLASPYATILQGTAIQDIVKTDDGYDVFSQASKQTEVPLKIHCKLLIGADGDKGVSRKKLLQGNEVAKTSAVGLRTYFDGVAGLHQENFIELHFLNEVLPGYFWIFPLPGGGANVGICMDSALVRKKKINLRELMLKAIAGNPNIKSRFTHATMSEKIYGWGLPMATTKTKLSGSNFMIIGDAASLIDPFTGEGIGNALFSGMLAAEATIKAFKEDRFDEEFLQKNYCDVLFNRIGDELKLSYTIQKLLRYPWLFNMIVNKAHKSPSLRHTMTSMFADLDVRALLRKPSFYWKVLVNR
jgi:geranylgeranyl reductase family protein